MRKIGCDADSDVLFETEKAPPYVGEHTGVSGWFATGGKLR